MKKISSVLIFKLGSTIKPMQKYFILPLFIGLAACSAQIQTPAAATTVSTPLFITATLPPTYTLQAVTQQSQLGTLTPTPQPTIAPLSGYVNSNINVRSGPGQQFDSVGLIAPANNVNVIGKDSTGEWYLIQFEEAALKVGWVTTQYVLINGNVERLPVLDFAPYVSATSTPAVTQQPTPQGAVAGVTSQQVNVRSGPGTVYDSFGQISANQTIAILGRNETSTWLQIAFADAPEGRGWVAALYIKVGDEIKDLPFLDLSGNPISVEAGSSGQVLATPTALPAIPDSDSASQPLAHLMLDSSRSRWQAFQDMVSAPTGDEVDYLSLSVAGDWPIKALVSLNCSGNGDVVVSTNGGWKLNSCTSAPVLVNFQPGQTVLLEIRAGEPAGELISVQYRLLVEFIP